MSFPLRLPQKNLPCSHYKEIRANARPWAYGSGRRHAVNGDKRVGNNRRGRRGAGTGSVCRRSMLLLKDFDCVKAWVTNEPGKFGASSLQVCCYMVPLFCCEERQIVQAIDAHVAAFLENITACLRPLVILHTNKHTTYIHTYNYDFPVTACEHVYIIYSLTKVLMYCSASYMQLDVVQQHYQFVC